MEKGGGTTAITLNIPPANRSNLVFTKVTCRNRTLEAIIDTGAEISVISPKACELLNINSLQNWEGPLLIMANGTRAQPNGTVTLEMVIGSTPVTAVAAVLPINGFDLLLGNNALRQLRTVQIEYDPEGAAVFSNNPESEPKAVSASTPTIVSRESRTIPALSMVTVAVEVQENEIEFLNLQLIIEPCNKILVTKGFSVGHLLLPFGENPCIANIKLVNFSRTDQWLNRGTVLGKFGTVEVMGRELDEADRPNEPVVGLLSIADPTTPFADVINKQLPPADQCAVLHLLNRFSDCFASSNSDLGRSNIVQHRIDTTNSTPIHQPHIKAHGSSER